MSAKLATMGRVCLAIALVALGVAKFLRSDPTQVALLTVATLEIAVAILLISVPSIKAICFLAVGCAAAGAALATVVAMLAGESLSRTCGCVAPSTTRGEALMLQGVLILSCTWLLSSDSSARARPLAERTQIQ